MTMNKKLHTQFIFAVILFFLSGCATMSLDYEEPSIELVSFNALPVNGFEQGFEVGLKLINPNNFELPLNGMNYQLSIAGETLATGVVADIPNISAYGESRFTVPVSTNLIRGIRVIKALMDNKGQDINYQLKTQLDIDIPLVPKLTITQDGVVPFSSNSL